jgi:deoxyribose-phosphate aldolase
MDQELDRIADVVAARIRAQLGSALPSAAADSCGGDCSGDCGGCGHCVVKRPEEVKAVVGTGATRISASPGTQDVDAHLAGLIDHTLLKPGTTPDDIKTLCDEARRYEFATVCVNSSQVSRCKALLGSSPVKVCAVVGFPLGAMAPGAKAYEAREAVRSGASEIDMVINIGALRSGDYALVSEDIGKVVNAARPARVKVILETGMLSDEEKVAGCTLSKLAGAHFVKTSTGFGKGGATVKDIALMRRVVGGAMGVKASGGIHNQQEAEQMVQAGANRIGASASVTIVTGGTSTSKY